jgi:predicted RNA binding protein YcfA (HicA-like mRNA interferase family)
VSNAQFAGFAGSPAGNLPYLTAILTVGKDAGAPSNGKIRIAEAVLSRVDFIRRTRHVRHMKVREVLKRLKDEGWVLDRQRGSHRQFIHPDLSGKRVTVAGHPNLDLPKGTLHSIFKQAGWN